MTIESDYLKGLFKGTLESDYWKRLFPYMHIYIYIHIYRYMHTYIDSTKSSKKTCMTIEDIEQHGGIWGYGVAPSPKTSAKTPP